MERCFRYLLIYRGFGLAISYISILELLADATIKQEQNEDISLADKVITATSILSGSLVLTADVNDFPRPFFSEAEEKLIEYRKKNKTNMISLQILRPNIVYINQRFSERPREQ